VTAGWRHSRRKDPNVKGLPVYQRSTLAELRLAGRDLYADIRRRGVMLPTGEVNPAVEAHRKNAHEQLYSLSVYTDLNRAHSQSAIELTPAECDEIIAAGTREESVNENAPADETPPAVEPPD